MNIKHISLINLLPNLKIPLLGKLVNDLFLITYIILFKFGQWNHALALTGIQKDIVIEQICESVTLATHLLFLYFGVTLFYFRI